MKMNLGCGSNWQKAGWYAMDHQKLRPFSLPPQAWQIPLPNSSCEIIFCSHVIEHIPQHCIEQTLVEINRVMSTGGILRILTPDLEVLARAYVNKDMDLLKKFVDEDGSEIPTKYGAGRILNGFLYSPGFDNIILNSSRSEIVSCCAHVFCYDFEMLEGLLKHYGFTDIRRMDIDESAISDHKELRNGPYDCDRGHSLVVECRKSVFVPFDPNNAMMMAGPYPWADIKGRKYVVTKLALALSSRIENFLQYVGRKIKRS